jgi:hypothetical protein
VTAAALGSRWRRALATALALACCIAPPAAADPRPGPDQGPAGAEAAHCATLIALFDDIIISRFDYQILMLEDYELAEARQWRDRAEADCAAGRYFFGTGLIESALRQIGVVPEPNDPRQPDPH